VKIENVARESFAARRTTKKERELAIRNSLLRKIIIDDESVLSVVAEVLSHRAARVGRNHLKRCHVRRGRGDDRRVFHRAEGLQLVDDLSNGRLLLTDGNVHAEHVLSALIDDGVDSNGRLAGLTIADDELALTTTDRNHRVDGLEARLHRLFDRLTLHDAGSLELDAAAFLGIDRALAVDRISKSVDNATHECRAYRNVEDTAGALDGIAFANAAVFTEESDTDVVLFEVQRHAHQVARKLKKLTGHAAREAVHAGDTVADRENSACLHDFDSFVVGGDLLLDDVGDFFRAELHRFPFFRTVSC
jgi:hypothetical protein